jgi:hypothetical protein
MPDIEIELGADPAQRLVDIERRSIAAAFVEHVARDRRETGTVGGIR